MGLLGMLLADLFFLKSRIFYKEIPQINRVNVLRSIIILSSLLFVILTVIRIYKDRLGILKILNAPYQRRALLLCLVLASVSLLLFFYSPNVFSYLSLEDRFTEWASVLLLFCNVIFILLALLKIVRLKKSYALLKGFMGLLLLGFFVIAMEEVSWFQRLLQIETPKAFRGNWQNEINLHNFSTLWAENIYYFGSFVFLVLCPFTALFAQKYISKFNLSILVPGVFVSIIGSIAFAFNYTMWNSILVQISFFGSLIILLVLVTLCEEIWKRNWIVVMGLLMISIQVTFLLNGERLIRSWELTEYKEFFIPLAFFFYCGDVWIKTKNLTPNK